MSDGPAPDVLPPGASCRPTAPGSRSTAWRPTAARLAKFHKGEAGSGVPREPVGLCLSGGGFRAALFHLGALRRLNEVGLLSQVDIVSCVSGGSIISAFLADRLQGKWPAAGQAIDKWDTAIELPFRRITALNMRRKPLWTQLTGRSAVEALTKVYRKKLSNLRLEQLPDKPLFIFGATDLVYRRYWTMSKDGIGSRATGHFLPSPVTPRWDVARATAASSCFPPVFAPMRAWSLLPAEYKVRRDAGHEGDVLFPVSNLLLTDGGVYDNTGYLAMWEKCDAILVSDGGSDLDIDGLHRFPRLYHLLMRYQSVSSYAGRGAQKGFILENLMSHRHGGAYWGLHTKTNKYEMNFGGYDPAIVDDLISTIRTDVACFSDGEQKILINHGYLLAAAAVATHIPEMLSQTKDPVTPYKEYMSPETVKRALAKSSKRKLFPR